MRPVDADALYNGTMKDEYFRFKEKDKSGREAFAYSCAMQRLVEAPTIPIQPDAPRVMTLEELDDLRGRGRAVWFENRDSSAKSQDVFFVVANDLYADLRGETYSMLEMVNDYRQTWRCWTSRPTDAQREAVKWDED